ncbi:MAG: sulfatase [Verrucomicrobiaceae bacterium]|nr:sulfatase [Verrucomicrobiaceae bacterium]
MRPLITLFALAALSSSASVMAQPPQPNFIVCIADDISFDDFGCYGSKCARTPRIDGLAARGMKFTEAYLTASSCSPSRSSIITGRYPHNNGPAAELHQPIAAHLPWLPGVLREAGYFTAIVGKNHMSRMGAPVGAETWDVIDAGTAPDNHGGESRWAETIAKRPKDKPFFFWFASLDAHRDWEAEGEWNEALYGPKNRPQDIIVPPFLADDEATRVDLTSYHNEITRFDYYVGKVADTLSEEGILDNTILVVLADNGRPFPRAKTRLHDSGMKTALVAHWPAGIAKAGSACASLVSVIDIAPTLLQAAGVTAPPSFQGVSFLPLFKDTQVVTRKYAFSEHNWHDYEAHGRSVRSGGWLYIRNQRPGLAWQGPADSVRSPSHVALKALRDANRLTPAQADVFLAPRPAEELYQTADDPLQLNNLASSAEHRETRARLSALLDSWIEETGDAAPDQLTPDGFDRESGRPVSKKKQTKRGDYPGLPKNAASLNAPGPR